MNLDFGDHIVAQFNIQNLKSLFSLNILQNNKHSSPNIALLFVQGIFWAQSS